MAKLVSDSKSYLKEMLYHSNLFEDFGFEYVGPVDGHDLESLCDAFERAKASDGPVLVHVDTIKGKGYSFAEKQRMPIMVFSNSTQNWAVVKIGRRISRQFSEAGLQKLRKKMLKSVPSRQQ